MLSFIDTDKKTRDGAVANLIAFLSEGGSLNVGDTGSKEPVQSSSNQLLSPLEMRKLWKGLFYCESARTRIGKVVYLMI